LGAAFFICRLGVSFLLTDLRKAWLASRSPHYAGCVAGVAGLFGMAVSRRSKRRSRSRDGFRQVAVVVGFGSVLSAGLFAGGYAVEQRYMPDLLKAFTGNGRGGTSTAVVADSDEIYTGSILYLPYEGSNCRQLLFDNRNGRFTDDGYIDCAQASSRSGINSPKQWSAARAKVISMGFRDH
jgi:hypothetical protein